MARADLLHRNAVRSRFPNPSSVGEGARILRAIDVVHECSRARGRGAKLGERSGVESLDVDLLFRCTAQKWASTEWIRVAKMGQVP